jgi:hypothetical protein
MREGVAQTAAQPVVAQDPTSIPARDWAVVTAEKEIELIEHRGSYLRYRQRSVDAKGDELRDVIESKDGTVARLIRRNNQPLTSEEDEAERSRLSGLLDHPNDFFRHINRETAAKRRAIDLIRLMPDAMLYTYAPGQPQTEGNRVHEVVVDYRPNPGFNAPTVLSEGLTGLRGRVWIDPATKEIVRMDGEIFHDINWGWGILAHIYPGGKVDLEQSEASGARWNLTHFHEQVTVKALMVKTMNVHAEVESMDFQALPGPMSYQDAVHLLLNTPRPQSADARP